MEGVRNFLNMVKMKAATKNPVFGLCSLQSATMGVAIMNIVFAVLYLIIAIIATFLITSAVGAAIAVEADKAKQEAAGETLTILATITAIVLIVVGLLALGLGVLLYIGAKKREYSKCRLWFVVNIVLGVIYIMNGLGGLTSFGGFLKFLLAVVISIYQLWIVFAFMQEINPENIGGLEGIPPSYQADEGDSQFTKIPQTNDIPTNYGQQKPNSDPYGWDT